jgi:tetratricopeptide (TPR) repeat protein
MRCVRTCGRLFSAPGAPRTGREPNPVKAMKKLVPPDSHYLDAAQGWLGLGDWASANQELDKISPEFYAYVSVLEARFQVYAAAKLWAMAAGIARARTAINPSCPFSWIDWAYALYELGRVSDARSVLLSVVDKFPDEYLICYSLACYACQLGNYSEALQWLEKAVRLADAKEARQMVVNNPDLQPLWNQMGES